MCDHAPAVIFFFFLWGRVYINKYALVSYFFFTILLLYSFYLPYTSLIILPFTLMLLIDVTILINLSATLILSMEDEESLFFRFYFFIDCLTFYTKLHLIFVNCFH